MSPGINRGIMEAVEAGAVTSVSLMVGMPASDDAIHAALTMRDILGVGVHFTLTVGRPLTRAESLVDRASGEFLPLARLLRRSLTGRIDPDEVVAECQAQISRAREAGLTVTHLDGHVHVHLAPGIAAAVRQAAIAEGIPAVRRPAEGFFCRPLSLRRLPERLLIRAFAASARPQSWPLRTTDHFMGSALLGAPDFEARLVAALDDLPTGTTELMVHPGYASAPLPGNDRYLAQRETELRALLSPAVLSRLRSRRFELIHFGNLRA
jgi:predicted glycoside hydrolase/deacetylase ChbG (UPF0249 family)